VRYLFMTSVGWRCLVFNLQVTGLTSLRLSTSEEWEAVGLGRDVVVEETPCSLVLWPILFPEPHRLE
jgi:hypothetical protein